MKRLHFGDNLELLKLLSAEYPQGIIDLIYIDPPFNSKRDYNVLFESLDMNDTTAQKQAFADTWSNVSYIDELNDLQVLDLDLYKFIKNLDSIRISKTSVAYLTTMAIRIYYMHKVLKDTGSFYLHCDPTMSHYLKIICDLIFSEKNYLNEIVWAYKERERFLRYWNRKHDIILFYVKNRESDYTFRVEEEGICEQYSKVTVSKFRYKDEIGLYQIRGKNVQGSPVQKADGLTPDDELLYPDLTYRQYLGKGVPARDWWQIDIINKSSDERLEYPTQKPEELLERIVRASSREGDIVADFFCGCGTAIAVANRLNRNWIGVDISHLAIRLVRDRLLKPLKGEQKRKLLRSMQVTGLPKDIDSAKELARNTESGRFSFQDWAIEIMLGGVSNKVKVGDGGFDGYTTFYKSEKEKETVIIEVKSGNVTVKNMREFIHVVEIQNAAIGVFVCFAEQVTKPMLYEAKNQGYYNVEEWGKLFPKIQIITVEQLLEGEGIAIPESTKTTFKTAKQVTKKHHNQETLL